MINQIMGRRNASEDGSVVTYNLAEGVDFSQTRDLADSLAEIVVRKECPHWYKPGGDGSFRFDPQHRVVVLIPGEEKRRVTSLIFRFSTKSVEMSLRRNYEESIEGSGSAGSAGAGYGLGEGLGNIFAGSGAGRFSRKMQIRGMASEIRKAVEFKMSEA